MLFSILKNKMRQDIERRAFVGTNPHATALQRTEFRDYVLRVVAQCQHSLRIIIDKLAGVCESWSFLRAVKERRSNLFFEAPDGDAYRRLSAEYPHSCFREAALLNDH